MHFQIPKLHFTEWDNQKTFPHSSFGAPLPGLAIQPSVWRESQHCPDFPKQLQLQVKHRLPWCFPTHWFAGGVDVHGLLLPHFIIFLSSRSFTWYSKLSALYTHPVISCHLVNLSLTIKKHLVDFSICNYFVHKTSSGFQFLLGFFLQEAWKVSHTLQDITVIFSFTCN